MYIEYKSKKFLPSGFEPKISCIPSRCLNHYASSVIVTCSIVSVYVYFCNWRLVTYVRRGTSRPTRPCHDVAGPSLNMDLFKAEVVVHSGTQLHPSPPLTGPATGTGTSPRDCQKVTLSALISFCRRALVLSPGRPDYFPLLVAARSGVARRPVSLLL